MKTFTRISTVLTLALAVCWGSMTAQQTCDAPLTLTCGDVTTFGSTAGVPNDNATSGAGTCVTTVGDAGQAWYSFTPPADGTVVLSLVSANTDYDTKIHVYTGACNALVCVTGNDDFVGLQSQVAFNITGNTTYLIRIGGYNANEGAFELTTTCDLVTDGCTDVNACNFDPIATNDDGSCCLGICETLVVDGGAFDAEVEWELQDPSGNVLATGGAPFNGFVCIPQADCGYQFIMSDTFGDGWNGNTFFFSDSEGNLEATGTLDDGFGPETAVIALGGLVSGCMDVLATNFDPSADCDDGSCVTCSGGEQLFNIEMTDAVGDGWDGAVWIIFDESFNTVATGTLDNGASGTFTECLAPGCYTMSVSAGAFPDEVGWSITDLGNNVVLSGGADVNMGFPWGGQTGCVIPGCMQDGCNNYNPFATEDDGSCICPPANDACATATAIGCGQTVNGTTINANPDGVLDACTGIAVTSPGVWYTFIGTGDQVNLTTCGSAGGDTKIHVFTGNCNTPICVAGNDDGCPTGLLSSITFTTVNGFVYNILVSEFGAGIGIDFTLEMNCIDCNGSAINDECANALPLPTGVDFPGNLCCANPDGDMAPWAGFGTQYGIWYVINSEDFDALDITFWNGSGEGPDAGDGTDVGIGLFDGADGCDALAPLVGGIGFDGNPLDGFIFNSYEFGLPLQPNTNYYLCLCTSDPVNCGDFVLNVTLTNVGCTDAAACNYCDDCTIDDGSCDYSCGGPANDLCADAVVLDCNSVTPGSTGGSTNTGAPTVCPVGAGDAGVWYTFTGDGQFVTLSTCGAQIDSRITVVSSANGCAGPYTCVISEDDDASDAGCGFFNGDDASVGFISEVGTVYYVYITAGGVDTDGDGADDLFDGSFDLSFDCAPVLEGCMDECACDYNANANVEGDCDYFSCAGCTAGSTAVMMDMVDTFGDGWNGNTYSIEDLDGNEVASGGLDDAACGDGATIGSNVFCLEDGCYNMTVGGGIFQGEVQWTLSDENGNTIDNGGVGTFSFTIGGGVCGCTDNTACNYDPAANSDDGSCEFTSCAGCTDNTACNFDADATINDPAQCCFDNCINFLMTDAFGDGWNGATAVIVDASSGNIVATAGLPAGFSGSAQFCLADGCYQITVGGGTFDGEITWTLTGVTGGILTGAANDPNGVGFSVGGANCVPGCTEPLACNYDETAGISDCTLCEYASCQGCTYVEAENYDAAALIDDGSCTFVEGNSDCPADFNGDLIIGVADLLEFINYYGQVCPTN